MKRAFGSLVLLCLLIVGCAGLERGDWTQSDLYFGEIPQKDWDAFLADTVTPRFPDGLTVLEGRGQWRNPAGVIERERSRVLVILHPSGAEQMEKIDEVRTIFLKHFGHESVLWVRRPARVDF